MARWLRLSNDDRVRAYLLQAVEAAVEYGRAEAWRRVSKEAAIPPGAQTNLAAELARDYVQSRVPDALNHFNIDTAGVDQMIRARIPGPPPAGRGLTHGR